MRAFRSDNNSGMCPEALEALAAVSDGRHRTGYGDDDLTAAAEAHFRRLFGDDIAVFFVATGTAANTLAIASMTEPWEQVLCHRHAHWNDDESTAPERITHCRTTPIVTDEASLSVEDVERMCANVRGDVHQPQPGVLTLSNVTEFGTVYTPEAMRRLCAVARDHGYRVHVDGARFANAVASTGVEPIELAGVAGVDALSFGGTKNGLSLGEAVVFFPQGDGAVFERARHAFPFHRKGTGHLLSKHWFVTAMFERVLRDGTWLEHARHANAMATMLGAGLADAGIPLRFPVEANGVFATLTPALHDHLQSRGHGYYPFGDTAWSVYRFMCSFDTRPSDIDAFVSDIRAVV